MTSDAKKALALIQTCLASDAFVTTEHFQQRLVKRGLFWMDVEGVVAEPSDVVDAGLDDYDRPKWLVRGDVEGIGPIEVVCAIESTPMTTFITLYWE